MVWKADKLGDWDDLTTTEPEFGTCTERKDTPQGMYFAIDQYPSRVRCEVQTHRDETGGVAIPAERAYAWEFLIPESVEFSYSQGRFDYNTINQFHSDLPCYSGGLAIIAGTEKLVLRVACTTNDIDLEVGQVQRNIWHNVMLRYNWHEGADGWVKTYFDGNLTATHHGPTVGIGATRQKFRVGFYLPDVMAGGVKMYVRRARVYAPV